MKKFIKLIFITFILITGITKVNAEDIGYISDYVFLYDLDSGQILIDKGSEERIFPASLTKMMTLIVAIENIDNPNETTLITEETLEGLKEARASRAGFDVGDEPTLLDLMYGVNLPSGADCTNALAYYVSGSLEGFVELMNQKALEIGMNDTHFVNVTGLHDDNHYSTLRDIAKLMEYGLTNELWTTIFKTESYRSIPVLNYPEGLGMESVVFKYINHPENTKLKYHATIEGFLGAKSGYTVEARYCLASIAEKDGINYALITAHAWEKREIPSNILDAEKIYNYYYNNYHKETFFNQNDLIATLPVQYNFFNRKIDIYSSDDVKKIINNNSNIEIIINTEEVLSAPLKTEVSIGKLEIYEDNKLIYQEDIYPSKNINRGIIAYILTILFYFVVENYLKIIAFLIISIMLTFLMKKITEKS